MSVLNPKLGMLLGQIPTVIDGLSKLAADLDSGYAEAAFGDALRRMDGQWRSRSLAVVWMGDTTWAAAPSANEGRWRTGRGVIGWQPQLDTVELSGLGLLECSNSQLLLLNPWSYGWLVHRAALVVLRNPTDALAQLWQSELDVCGVPLVQALAADEVGVPGLPVWRLPEVAVEDPLALLDKALVESLRQSLATRLFVDQLNDLGRAMLVRVEQDGYRIDARLSVLDSQRQGGVDADVSGFRKDQLGRLKDEVQERLGEVIDELKERSRRTEDLEVMFLAAFREILGGLSHEARKGDLEEELPTSYLNRFHMAGPARFLGGSYKVKLRLTLDARERVREGALAIIRKRCKAMLSETRKHLDPVANELSMRTRELGAPLPEGIANAYDVNSEQVANTELAHVFDREAARVEFEVDRTGVFGSIMKARVAATSLLMMSTMIIGGLAFKRPPFQTIAVATLILLALLMIWRWFTKPLEEDDSRREKLTDLRDRLEKTLFKAAQQTVQRQADLLVQPLNALRQQWVRAVSDEVSRAGAQQAGQAQRQSQDQNERNALTQQKQALAGRQLPMQQAMSTLSKIQGELRGLAAETLKAVWSARAP